jgi:hypothetical protein
MINPGSRYASQIDLSDANYPYGKARNISVSLDGTGTPLEKDWLNDWFGFQQAVAAKAGVVPSGTSDNATASQVLAGLRSIKPTGLYNIPIGAPIRNSNTRFSIGSPGYWMQSDITDAGDLGFVINAPVGAVISRVAMYCRGRNSIYAAIHSALPASKPNISVYSGIPGENNVALATLVTDPSASVAAYETPHYVEITGLSVTVAAGTRYVVLISGESGANAVANAFVMQNVEVTLV